MPLFARARQRDPEFACLRCSAKGVTPDAGPARWWLLPGCGHVGGRAALCGACKEQIDQGAGVPGAFGCPCGAEPVITPAGGDR